MTGRPQSWRRMSLLAKAFVGLVVLLGGVVLTLGTINPVSQNIAEFICYLLIALLASRLTVNLPEIADTMSVNFLFILVGIIDLSFTEALLLGAVAVMIQSFYRTNHRPIRVAFNICASASAISLAYGMYHLRQFHGFLENRALLLLIAASTYFVANTGLIATAIALIERKSLKRLWMNCYSWAFPYCLGGAVIAGLIAWLNRSFSWETSLLVLPVMYVIYRSYRLYLSKQEEKKGHIEEMANLHLRTIEALALAIEAKDHTTHDHLERVQVYAIEVAKEMDLSQSDMEALHAAALLYDIGKLAVPEHIISKPGRLTDRKSVV